MPTVFEEYQIGMMLGYTPVPCIMCSIKTQVCFRVGLSTVIGACDANGCELNRALDCPYCAGSMMRMVPPGCTSEQAVHMAPLRYRDMPWSSIPRQNRAAYVETSGSQRPPRESGAGSRNSSSTPRSSDSSTSS